MGKWKRVLFIVLRVLAGAALVAISFAIQFLPRKLGVEWIIGWPQFFSYLLYYATIYLGVFLILPKSLRGKRLNPKPGQTPEQVKRNTKITYVFLGVLFFVHSVLVGFVIQWQKIDRYERSPSGRNKALVWVDKKDKNFSAICPVRAGLFYEDDNKVYLSPKYEDITFTWLDDNTLEITKTRKNSGEVETDCLRW